MNNNFITSLLVLLIVGMIGCLAVFGINAYVELGTAMNNESNTIDTEAVFSSIEKKEDIATPNVVEKPIDDVGDTFLDDNMSYQSSASNTRYFYTQLDNYSKTIYDGLVANSENMKSGTYKVEFGDAFNDVLSKENGSDELGNYYQSAIEAFTYDNPDVFYLDPTKMFLNIQTKTKGLKKSYNVYISCADGSSYLAKEFSSQEEINNCQSQIEQAKNQVVSRATGDTYNKVKQIHDYLVDTISYDQTISKNNIYNLYGALVNKDCVCEGYSKALKYLLDQVGVDNVIVLGTATNSKGETENHAWNYVAINGAWYAVDTTWDDPIIQGGGSILSSTYKYKYFLKGASTIGKDHISNGQFTKDGKIFSYPNLSNIDFN